MDSKVFQVCRVLPERRVHKELLVLKVYKVQLAVLDHRAFKVLLVLQALQVFRAHKVLRVHKDHRAFREVLDHRAFKVL
jgi:hypothetical protein